MKHRVVSTGSRSLTRMVNCVDAALGEAGATLTGRQRRAFLAELVHQLDQSGLTLTAQTSASTTAERCEPCRVEMEQLLAQEAALVDAITTRKANR